MPAFLSLLSGSLTASVDGFNKKLVNLDTN